MADEFDEFEVGAVPPFGSMFDALELVDERLLEHDRILCSGGVASRSAYEGSVQAVLVDPRDVVRAGEARVADICES